MARDIDRRLDALRNRRTGRDRIESLALESKNQVLAKSLIQESYEKRAPTQKYTKYALGVMQEVDPDYTRISLEEADRVKRQLENGLDRKSIPREFQLQGSVVCNIHIRGVSDVDLLLLDGRFIRYASNGQKSLRGGYANNFSQDTLLGLTQKPLKFSHHEI